jgi:hypothetical protein
MWKHTLILDHPRHVPTCPRVWYASDAVDANRSTWIRFQKIPTVLATTCIWQTSTLLTVYRFTCRLRQRTLRLDSNCRVCLWTSWSPSDALWTKLVLSGWLIPNPEHNEIATQLSKMSRWLFKGLHALSLTAADMEG